MFSLFSRLSGRTAAAVAPVDPCNEKVNRVAAALAGESPAWRTLAATAAAELGPASIEHLATLFHTEHTPPPDVPAPRLGQWMSARQFAIFEIFYHFGGAALPVLKRVAFGAYDWTQGNAIEILCRLAADGIEQDDIVDALVRHLPALREEAHVYALRPLLQRTATDPGLAAVIAQLLIVPEFKEAHDALIGAA